MRTYLLILISLGSSAFSFQNESKASEVVVTSVDTHVLNAAAENGSTSENVVAMLSIILES